MPGPGGVWSGWVSAPRGCLLPGGCLLQGVVYARGGRVPACTEADPPGETATAADGTHHTGMHSRWGKSFLT